MPLPYFQKISMLEKVRYRYLTGCMESTRTYRYKEKTWGKVNFYIVQVPYIPLPGTESGVGCASPVGGWTRTGTVTRPAPSRPFCWAIW